MAVVGLIATLGILAGASVATAGDGKKEKIDAYKELTRANTLASRGALTRAIPHYEAVIEAEPINYAIASYNLGEVLKAKSECPKAVLRYQAYMNLGTDDSTKRASKQGVKDCTLSEWGALKFEVTPPESLELYIDGILIATSVPAESIVLAPGSYKVRVEVADHEVIEEKVEIDAEEVTRSFAPEKMTFFGTAEISVDQDGAKISLTPKALDKANPDAKPIETTSPAAEPMKLATGKYFLEVTKPGYRRWIRNIYITRDAPTPVEVRLTADLPSEIQ